MVATLQNHSGIHNITARLNMAKPGHKLSKLSSKAPSEAPPKSGQKEILRPYKTRFDYPPSVPFSFPLCLASVLQLKSVLSQSDDSGGYCSMAKLQQA